MNLKQQTQSEMVRLDSHEQMASFGGEKKPKQRKQPNKERWKSNQLKN